MRPFAEAERAADDELGVGRQSAEVIVAEVGPGDVALAPRDRRAPGELGGRCARRMTESGGGTAERPDDWARGAGG